MLFRLVPLALAWSALTAAPSLSAQEQPKLDYGAYANEFREAHNLSNAMPGTLHLGALLDTDGFRRFNLGALDLRISADSLKDRDVAKNFI